MMSRLLLASLLLAMNAPVWAQDGIALAGVEASRDNRYAYLGTVLPLPGSRLGQGYVQRYWLDYVAYRYEKTPQLEIDTRMTGAEAALGYQQSSTSGWWGAYLGARYASTRLRPDDPDNDDQGRRLRAKLQFEGETEMGAGWRINGIASHLVGDANYWARLRLQTQLRNQWRVGPEVVVQGDSNYSAYKVGAFVGNIGLGAATALTLKAGVNKPEDDPASMYLGAEFYIPF
ncbi:cellulose biosynthesis protein BcsS [Thiobacillus denitrificans]|jgi:hypothetical protein|uniref:cellulose biosynthesis protein BcsS n=1 Tax=Thiobacillus denitrificans TaxID=36861 RepID=UPI0009DB6AFB|nr:cellulose biosynthesis protein BcsS [Thiobacillus denitrificans]